MRRAALVLDISEHDAAFWRARGIGNVEVVPTFLGDAATAGPSVEAGDVLYVGNLYMPANRNGVHWFLSQVVPVVHMPPPARSAKT